MSIESLTRISADLQGVISPLAENPDFKYLTYELTSFTKIRGFMVGHPGGALLIESWRLMLGEMS